MFGNFQKKKKSLVDEPPPHAALVPVPVCPHSHSIAYFSALWAAWFKAWDGTVFCSLLYPSLRQSDWHRVNINIFLLYDRMKSFPGVLGSRKANHWKHVEPEQCLLSCLTSSHAAALPESSRKATVPGKDLMALEKIYLNGEGESRFRHWNLCSE